MPIVKKSLVLFAVLFTHLAQAGQSPSLEPAAATPVSGELARQVHLFATARYESDDRDLLGLPRGEPVSVSAHTTVLKFHPLAMIGGGLLGMLMVPVELELAVHPNFSLSTMVTPFGGSVGGVAINGSARVYFSGNAPDGFWLGGQVGATVLVAGSQLGLGFDLQPSIGYQWVLDNGFTIGLGAGISVAAVMNQRSPLVFQVPIGFAW